MDLIVRLYDLDMLTLNSLYNYFRIIPFPERFPDINPIERDIDHMDAQKRHVANVHFNLQLGG